MFTKVGLEDTKEFAQTVSTNKIDIYTYIVSYIRASTLPKELLLEVLQEYIDKAKVFLQKEALELIDYSSQNLAINLKEGI